MKKITLALSLLALASTSIFAQAPADQPPQPSSGGWRRVDEAPPAPPQDQPQENANRTFRDPEPYAPYPEQQGGRVPAPMAAPAGMPAQLTLRTGAFITVRADQFLSTDRNQVGDAFSATLIQPLVVDGIVVAQRGQMVGGRIFEVQKSSRDQMSRLGVELTDLTLVDGNPAPIQARLVRNTGPAPVGRDAGAIVGTTGAGAVIGAIAGGGVGAGVGAIVGAAAGTIGVLATRGRATVIYPESILTFRIEQPVSIDTSRAPQAFRYMDANQYRNDRPYDSRMRMGPPPQGQPYPQTYAYPAPAPMPYYYNPYYYYGYPAYYGGFSLYLGRPYYRHYGGGIVVGRYGRR